MHFGIKDTQILLGTSDSTWRYAHCDLKSKPKLLQGFYPTIYDIMIFKFVVESTQI